MADTGGEMAQPIKLQHLHYCLRRILLKLDRNIELVRAVDVIMARTKRIYILMIKVNKGEFSFWCRGIFESLTILQGMINSNTYRQSSGELEKVVEIETLACGSCSDSISITQ